VHDFLTRLPYRFLLSDRISTAVALADRKRSKLAICAVDLDGFKGINDSCGHQGGDEVLREIARRFTVALHKYDSVARLGGDEFVILLAEVIERKLRLLSIES
jgi:diguanylate cyclase